MNAYYLVDADKVEQARQLAPSVGLPNQLFQYCISLDGTKAIVQADWSEEALMWLNANGTFLGELQPDGGATQAVYDYMNSDDWIFN